MKKHLLGFLLSFVTFAVGFGISPVWYGCTGMGHGSTDDGGSFWVHPYTSSWLVSVTDAGEGYQTPEKTVAVFHQRVADSLQITQFTPNERAVLLRRDRQIGLKYYCVVKVQERVLRTTCSTSLAHVLDFEKSTRKY